MSKASDLPLKEGLRHLAPPRVDEGKKRPRTRLQKLADMMEGKHPRFPSLSSQAMLLFNTDILRSSSKPSAGLHFTIPAHPMVRTVDCIALRLALY